MKLSLHNIFVGFILIFSLQVKANLITEVSSILQNDTWTNIEDAKYVKYKPGNWANKNDLSFRYKIKDKEGILYIQVEVLDNNVVLKNDSSIVSDHVELWLCDRNITAIFKNDIDELKLLLKESKDYSKVLKDNPDSSLLKNDSSDNLMVGMNRYFYQEYSTINIEDSDYISSLKESLYKYLNDKYFTQIIFNNKSNSSYFHKIQQDYQYEYSIQNGGYAFFLKIPLKNKFDITDYIFSNLGFMIDVVDVDSLNAAKQKNIISSSFNREYANPSTFNGLCLAAPLTMPISDSLLNLKLTFGEGIFRLKSNGYEYNIRNKDSYTNGWKTVYFPGGYNSLRMYLTYADKTLSVYNCRRTLILHNKKENKILDISNYLDNPQDEPDVIVEYSNGESFIIQVRGLSNLNVDGECGLGHEINILFFELNRENLCLKKPIESFHVQSCYQGIYSNPHDTGAINEDDFQIVPLFIKNEDTLSLDYEEEYYLYDNSYEITTSKLIFDISKPELGIRRSCVMTAK